MDTDGLTIQDLFEKMKTTWEHCRPLTREEVEQYLVKEN